MMLDKSLYVEQKMDWKEYEQKAKAEVSYIYKKTPAPKKIWSNTEIIKEIKRVWGKDSQDAICIATCESNLRPGAIGDKWSAFKSYGVFQIRHLPGRPAISKLLDPAFNIRYAYNLFLHNGWRPWRICSYKCGLR